jgi:iron complex transport system substrate-binding protein
VRFSLHFPSRRPLLAGLVAATLVLAGCGGDSDADDAGDRDAPAQDVPTAIVSLSPTVTEMLWAIGAGDQVVAVDDQSDYPDGIPVTDLSAYEPNVEAILGYEPDLVITSGGEDDVVKSLEQVDVPVLVLPSAEDLDESYAQIEQLGEGTGHADEAEQVVEDVRAGIEAAVEAAPDATGVTYFHELGPDLFSVGSDTFIGQMYSLFGLENIAEAAAEGDDYPQLNSEYVVEADPDLVLIADNECCGVTAEDVAGRAGWEDVDAVDNGQLHVVDEDVTSRWGPRVVEFAEIVSGILTDNAEALGLQD